jgi:CheY-like chemotaxis protein
MSGIEAVQALRASGNRRQFVVGCTGNALEEDQAQYLVAGANAILPKPVHQKDLEAKLTEVHDRRAQGHLNDDSSSGDDMDGC